MIFIDYSAISMAAIFADKGFQEAAKNPSKESKALLKHMVLNSIRSYKVKNKPIYGDLVICADGKNNWRRTYFKYYKAKRKKNREASPVDWAFVFDVMSETLNDLKLNFPYPVLHFDSAEGDDCIAVGIDWAIKNKVTAGSIFSEPEMNLVIASDADYHQLQATGYVHQYSPMLKKYIKLSKQEATDSLLQKVIKGDPGDGIPNIMSDDDVFVSDAKRQRPITKNLYETYKVYVGSFRKTDSDDQIQHNQPPLSGIDDILKRNIERNLTLVDFNFIPSDIKKAIYDGMSNAIAEKQSYGKMKMMHYFMANDMKHLLEVVDQF